MKRILFMFSTLFFAILLSLHAFATDAEGGVTRLEKSYYSLNEHLYTPFFSESKLYEGFKEEMELSRAALKLGNLSDENADILFNKLKTAYSALMLDVFDYSDLTDARKFYEKLDASLFTEASWSQMQTAADFLIAELESPSLITGASALTKEEYTQKMDQHIVEVLNSFTDAYHTLEMKELPEAFTKNQLICLVTMTEESTREDLLSKSEHWKNLQSAIKEGKRVMGKAKPLQSSIDSAVKDLLEKYLAATSASFDFSVIEKTLSAYYEVIKDNYTQNSWNQYESAAMKLDDQRKKPFFFYFSDEIKTEEALATIAQAFQALCKETDALYLNLVPMSTYLELSDLCNLYRNTTSEIALKGKTEILLSHVAQGDALLQRGNATQQEMLDQIQLIQSAANDLKLAESFLYEEKQAIIEQDRETIQRIIIVTTVTVFLAFFTAIIISYRHFRRIDWTR